ncbi:Cenp-O kinetochore centromere component-domain-containing protein [Coniochaeta sp. 2T2.1]|nr:Cenp-O kinetochore centromere component-domain-containing protein [Coniochaeta sp. 2T2.1]
MATERPDSEEAMLDDEIANLKKRAKRLRADIKTHCSTIASAFAPEDFPAELVDIISQQQAHTQESLWRIGAGVTAFKVQDPDPRAVNGGSVLGIRFEIMRGGRFIQTYVVLLNRPYGKDGQEDDVAKAYLRVHRHTIPNCIPLGGLAARYLPPHTVTDAIGDDDGPAKRKTQDLSLFVKELRQRLVAYHNRLGAVADMRRAAGLVDADEKRRNKRKRRRTEGESEVPDESAGSSEEDESEDGDGDGGAPRIIEFSSKDAEAKQIEVNWSNGDLCRIVLDDDGEIEKCVMFGANGQRDAAAARDFQQRVTRVDRLQDAIRRKQGLEPA